MKHSSQDKPLDIGTLASNMQIKQADGNNLIWYEASETPIELVGFNWFKTDRVFRRMPLNPPTALPEAVETLAWQTAGGQVRFRTNSTRIIVKVTLRNATPMDHMPLTGSSGCDLYVGEPGAMNFRSVTRIALDANEYTCELFKDTKQKMRSFCLNLPLYSGVATLEIGIDNGSKLKAPTAWADTRKILIYGSSITQGGCASRPGMAYTNILSRKLNMPVYNYGFSGSGRGEPEVAHCIAAIEDVSIFVLDYEANCHQPGGLETTLPVFIDIIRSRHPTTPVLVVSRIHYSVDDARYEARRDVQHNEVARRNAAGDKNVHFLDGATLLGADAKECSVDGVHQTDLGFYRMAENMEPVIARILTSSASLGRENVKKPR